MMRAFVLVLGMAAIAEGQSPAPGNEFPTRLDPETRLVLTRLADSARAARLPVEPLVSKAAEGVLKGADDARIVAAVRALVRQLGDARAIMPAGTSTATLTAAASALRAGVSTETLRGLIDAGRGTRADEFDLALITLADLAANGVTPSRAGDAVSDLLRRGTPGRALAALRSAIAQDIGAGVSPERALATRMEVFTRGVTP
jgi:hypothetical protein